nr:hypothetical protein 60 [Pelagibacteraceae bacterium]
MPYRKAGEMLRAFDMQSDGSWKQTPETKKALDLVRSAGGRDFEIEAAPSVLANDGVGMWGTGGGVYYPGTDKAYVDPIKGTVTTAVHEAAHASFPTKLVDKEQQKAAYEKLNKSFATATPGNNLRAVYETISKPIMLEEANAQGVAKAVMDKTGLTYNNSGWKGVPMEKTGLSDDIRPELSYPGEYRFGGKYDRGGKVYAEVTGLDQGRELMQEERDAIQMTRNSLVPAMERQFQKGYNLIK